MPGPTADQIAGAFQAGVQGPSADQIAASFAPTSTPGPNASEISAAFGSPSGPVTRGEKAYRSLVDKYAQQAGLDPEAVAAVIDHESSWNPHAINYNKNKFGQVTSTDYGIMQVNSSHNPQNVWNPESNIRQGVNILRDALNVSGGDYRKAFAIYNGGQGGAGSPAAQKYAASVYSDFSRRKGGNPGYHLRTPVKSTFDMGPDENPNQIAASQSRIASASRPTASISSANEPLMAKIIQDATVLSTLPGTPLGTLQGIFRSPSAQHAAQFVKNAGADAIDLVDAMGNQLVGKTPDPSLNFNQNPYREYTFSSIPNKQKIPRALSTAAFDLYQHPLATLTGAASQMDPNLAVPGLHEVPEAIATTRSSVISALARRSGRVSTEEPAASLQLQPRGAASEAQIQQAMDAAEAERVAPKGRQMPAMQLPGEPQIMDTTPPPGVNFVEPSPTGPHTGAVTPTEAPAVAEQASEAQAPPARLVQDFPVSQIKADPERFQYKINRGAGGQTGSLSGAKEWNPDYAGIMDVWRDPADGQTYVVNGHNRLALANRVGQDAVDVRYIDAATAQEARTKGALINIAEGQGTATDAAKLFRDGNFTPDELREGGLNLNSNIVRQGLALKNLAPSIFNQVVRGELGTERATIIGEKLPDPADQVALMGLLAKVGKRRVLTDGIVGELADQVAAAPRDTHTTASLFGEDATTQNLAVERAVVADYLRSQMKTEGRVFGVAARNADTLAKGENTINAEKSAQIAQSNVQGIDVFDRLKNAKGVVSDILNDAARRLAKGENANAVKQGALSRFQAELPAILHDYGAVSDPEVTGDLFASEPGSATSSTTAIPGTGANGGRDLGSEPARPGALAAGSGAGNPSGGGAAERGAAGGGAGTRGEAVGAAREQGVAPTKPLYEMSPDELLDARDRAKGDLHATAVYVFGEEGARRYESLERTANSWDFTRADPATNEMKAMEAGLTEDQQDILFGIKEPPAGAYPHDIEDVRQFRDHVQHIGDAEDAAHQIGYGLIRMARDYHGGDLSPAAMETYAQVGYSMVRQALLDAKQLGLSTHQITAHAIDFAISRFDNPHDAVDHLQPILDKLGFGKVEEERTNQPISVPSSLTSDLKPGESKNILGFSLSDSAGMMGGQAASQLIEKGVDLVGEHIRTLGTNLAETAQKTAAQTHGGRYRASEPFGKDVVAALNQAASADEYAHTYAVLADRFVHAGLSPAERDLLGRWYADQRAQALDATGNTGHNVPRLTPAEQSQVVNNPRIQDAITRYDNTPGKFLYEQRKFVSPRMPDVQTPSGSFASLVKKDTGATARPGGSLASQQRLKGSRFAKQATGMADEYETDLGKGLQVTVPEVVGKSMQRNLYKTILAQRDNAGNKLAYTNVGTQKLPSEIEWNGKVYPASRPVEIGTRVYKTASGKPVSQPILMVVPEPMYDNIRDVTTTDRPIQGIAAVGKEWQSLATGLTLTNPLAVIGHFNRVLSLAKAIPGMTRMPAIAGRIQVLSKLVNMDMSDPANVAALDRLMKNNAGSSRPFQGAEAGKLANPISRYQHGSLFALPEGKGVGQLFGGKFGLDLRVRMAAEGIRAQMEGNEDPARIREFANQFGQYTQKPDWIVQYAKNVHPFSATSLPMRITEFRQLTGGAGFKGLSPAQQALIRARVLANGAAGTALGLAALNYTLSGHWPWQNSKGHEYDLQITRHGQPIYISSTYLLPALSRPLRTIGAVDLTTDTRTPASADKRAIQGASDLGRGLTNTSLEEIGSPLLSAAYTGATGNALYETRGGDMLHVANKPSYQAGHPVSNVLHSKPAENIYAGLGTLTPFVSPRTIGAQSDYNATDRNFLLRMLLNQGILRKDKIAH